VNASDIEKNVNTTLEKCKPQIQQLSKVICEEFSSELKEIYPDKNIFELSQTPEFELMIQLITARLEAGVYLEITFNTVHKLRENE
jgi:hypothetical protein